MAGGSKAADNRASRVTGVVASNKGIWEGLLTEVATVGKAPDAKLLCLGRPGIGKRTLLQALHQYACPLAVQTEASASHEVGHSRAVGLDFAHFGARDPELEEAQSGQDFNCPAACSVLILEDVVHEKLLMSRLKPMALQLCAAIICLDLKTPWTMLEDLRQWLEVLKRVVGELMQQLPLEEQDRLREQISDELAAYTEPSTNVDASPEASQGEASAGQDSPEAKGKAGASALTYNFGIPVVVVVTRADTASALESPKTVGWSEIIEAFLRNECLPYGAAIVYTSVGGAQAKSTRNIDVLYEYLMHRLYGHALKSSPNVPSRDALFVPGGWDSRERVDKTASSLEHGLERSFESSVVSLEPAPPPLPAPVAYEDMQKFLKSSAAVLQKLGAVSARSDKAKATLAAAGGGAKKATEIAASGSGKRASIDAAAKGGIGKEDKASVANFFQNLLTRGQSGAALGGEKRTSSASTAAAGTAAKAPAAAPAGPTKGAEDAKLAPPSPGAEFSGVSLKVDSEKPEKPEQASAPENAEAAAPAEG